MHIVYQWHSIERFQTEKKITLTCLATEILLNVVVVMEQTLHNIKYELKSVIVVKQKYTNLEESLLDNSGLAVF